MIDWRDIFAEAKETKIKNLFSLNGFLCLRSEQYVTILSVCVLEQTKKAGLCGYFF